MRYIGIRKVVLLYSHSLFTIQFRTSIYVPTICWHWKKRRQSILVSVPRHLFTFLAYCQGPKATAALRRRPRCDDKEIKALLVQGGTLSSNSCARSQQSPPCPAMPGGWCSMTSFLKTMPTMLMTNEGTKTSAMSMNP